jgi:hypothetical protein
MARCGQTLQPLIDGHHDMTDDRAVLQPRTEPAIAIAEEGLVLLDGPDGLAVTMTPAAAATTGKNLIDAAAEAEAQSRQDTALEAPG